MSFQLFGAFVVFAVVASITPGPNNAMLLASGVNFGIRRSLPHMAGVECGFLLMVLTIGLGLGSLFTAYPWLYVILRYAGGAYLLYLAWKIARAGELSNASVRAAPMTFAQAMAFQWVNPKAWVMIIGALSTYAAPEHYFISVLTMAAGFAVIGLPCIVIWNVLGSSLRSFLQEPRRLRVFNAAMAVLLVGSLYPLVLDLF